MAECGTTFYIYIGGRAPRDVSHVRIDKSTFSVDDFAFHDCDRLEYVETHKALTKIGKSSFEGCVSLRTIDLSRVKIIEQSAFKKCRAITEAQMTEVERIGKAAFQHCTTLRKVAAPSAESIGEDAFCWCDCLVSAEFGVRLHTIGQLAFYGCLDLSYIAIPLPLWRRDMVQEQAFTWCPKLSSVHLVGKLYTSVQYIAMAIWREQMWETINQINLDLPTLLSPLSDAKTAAIIRWMEEVQDKIIHFKILHSMWLVRATSILELALWKVKLEEIEDEAQEPKIKRAKATEGGSMALSSNNSTREYRQEQRIKCGAGIIIKNVVSFLKLSRRDDTF